MMVLCIWIYANNTLTLSFKKKKTATTFDCTDCVECVINDWSEERFSMGGK